MKNKIFNMIEIRKIDNNYNIGVIKDIKPILEGASSEYFKTISQSGDYLFKGTEISN